MAEFVPTPGFANCPKCGGWQVLDYTKRNKANMEPIGPLDHRDCDKCNGAGQLRLTPLPVNKPKANAKVGIDVGVPIPQNEPVASSCWHINKKEVWGKKVCSDCGKEL